MPTGFGVRFLHGLRSTATAHRTGDASASMEPNPPVLPRLALVAGRGEDYPSYWETTPRASERSSSVCEVERGAYRS
jgi:hypothetical protein